MLNEKSLSFNEVVNYGLPHLLSPRLDFNVIKTFYSKEDVKYLEKDIDNLKRKLINEYSIAEPIVESYLKNGYFLLIASNGTEKKVYLDISTLYAKILNSFVPSNEIDDFCNKLNKENCDEKMFENYAIEELKELRNKISKSDSSDTFDLKKYLANPNQSWIYVMYKMSRINLIEINKKYDGLREYVKTLITKIIVAHKYLVKDFKNLTISFDKIDQEKFLFYVNARILNTCREMNKIDNSIYSVINYYMDKCEDGIPDLSFTYKDDNDKISKYTFKNFLEDLKDYVLKHPEINLAHLNSNIFKDMEVEDVEKYLTEFTNETLNNFEVVNPETIFLPNNTESGKKREISGKKKNKSSEISLLVLQKRMFYSENRYKLYKTLMGKNKFKGYIANIFKNGNVIFEKYDFKEGNISTKPGAAYIMTVNNFNTFCKKNISEIREYIKNNKGESKIEFKCHRGNWEEYIQNKIDEDTGISLEEVEKVLKKKI